MKNNSVVLWNYSSICPYCRKPFIYVGDVPRDGFPVGQEPYCTCNDDALLDILQKVKKMLDHVESTLRSRGVL